MAVCVKARSFPYSSGRLTVILFTHSNFVAVSPLLYTVFGGSIEVYLSGPQNVYRRIQDT